MEEKMNSILPYLFVALRSIRGDVHQMTGQRQIWTEYEAIHMWMLLDSIRTGECALTECVK